MKKAIFEQSGETERPYNGSTEMYEFNSNYIKGKSIHVVLKDQDIFKLNGRVFPCSQIPLSINDKIFWIDDLTYITWVLKPMKRSFKYDNFNIYHNTVICVGNKRPTTNLPSGLIYQRIQKKLTANFIYPH